MNGNCGCCDGITTLVPRPTSNRPGLDALKYRIGTHATFFESLLARISTLCEGTSRECRTDPAFFKLRQALTTRDKSDPAIALFDAWAAMADVLTFYQERIANEGYLRTALERRSVQELARLVGYQLRPGVSAQAYLAFEVEDTSAPPTAVPAAPGSRNASASSATEIIIPQGTAVKSTPTPGTNEQPQTFETSRELKARPEWNVLRPRLTRPQLITPVTLPELKTLYFKGVGLRLKPNDCLAFVLPSAVAPECIRIVDVRENALDEVTIVTLSDNPLSTRALVALVREAEVALDQLLRSQLYTSEEWLKLHSSLGRYFTVHLGNLTELSVIDADKKITTNLVHAFSGKGASTDVEFIRHIARSLVPRASEAIKDVTHVLDGAKSAFLSACIQNIDMHMLSLRTLDRVRSLLEKITPSADESAWCLEADAALSLGVMGLNDTRVIRPYLAFGSQCNATVAPDSELLLPLTVQIGPTDSSAPEPDFTLRVRLVVASQHDAGKVGFVNGQSLESRVEVTASDISQLRAKLSTLKFKSTVQGGYNVEAIADQIEGDPLWERIDDIRDFRIVVTSAQPVDQTIAIEPLALYAIYPGPMRIATGVKLPGEWKEPWTCRISIPDESAGLLVTSQFPEGASSILVQEESAAAFVAGLNDVKLNLSHRLDGTTQTRFVRFEFFPEGPPQSSAALPASATVRRIVLTPVDDSYYPLSTQFATALAVIAASSSAAAPTFNDLRGKLVQTPSLLVKLSELRASIPRNGEHLKPIVAAISDGVTDTLSTLEASTPQPLNDPLRSLLSSLAQRLARLGVDLQNAADRARDVATTPVTDPEMSAFRKGDIDALLSTFRIRLATNEIKNVTEIGELFDSLVANVKNAPTSRYATLLTNVRASAAALLQNLVSLRKLLLDRVEETVRLHTPPLKNDPSSDLLAALEKLRQEFQSDVSSFQDANADAQSGIPLTLGTAVRFIQRQLGGACDCHESETCRDNPSPIIATGDIPTTMMERLKYITDQLTRHPDQEDRNADGRIEIESALRIFRDLVGSEASASVVVARNLANMLSRNAGLFPELLRVLSAGEQAILQNILRTYVEADPVLAVNVRILRSEARVFGWNAPEMAPSPTDTKTLVDPLAKNAPDEEAGIVFLDNKYSRIGVGSPIAIQHARSASLTGYFMGSASSRPRTAYRISSESTRAELRARTWWDPTDDKQRPEYIRGSRVYCEDEPLVLAEEPLVENNRVTAGTTAIELDDIFVGLSTDKEVVIEGVVSATVSDAETGDAPESAKPVSEVVRIVSVELSKLSPSRFGDRFRTRIGFSPALKNTFRRDSIRVYANVVDATHGESQRNVLGSGGGVTSFQSFVLRRPELSQLPSATPRGSTSQLDIHINNVAWPAADSFHDADPDTQIFVARTDDSQQTTVTFGDGVTGTRLPTGTDNVRATYRTGIGAKGNIAAGQVNQLVGAPLGVKKAWNPLKARGGADPESRDLAREHVPLAIMSMDRLVSVQDFADFSRGFAGIGKASATNLQGVVHVTIARLDPDPFDRDGPLYLNLQRALELYGDPSQRFEIHNRDAALLILFAKVRIDPQFDWSKVEPEIRSALLERFGYERCELAKDLLLSDAIAAMQSVDGVAYVDVDKFDAVEEQQISYLAGRLSCLKLRPRVFVRDMRITSDAQELEALGLEVDCRRMMSLPQGQTPPQTGGTLPAVDETKLRPAQLCYLTRDIPDTLLLEQIR